MVSQGELDPQALEDLLHGACFLGSGGGGPLSGGRHLLRLIRETGRHPSIVKPEGLSPNAQAAMVAGIGSPDAATEQHGSAFSQAPKAAFSRLESQLPHSLDHVLPGEIGAMNSLIPVLVAAQTGLPVVDADGAGRAIPTLSLSRFAQAPGVDIDPYVLTNAGGQAKRIECVIHAQSASEADVTTRGIVTTPAYGREGAFATWAMGKHDLEGAAIPGTLSLARATGEALRRAPGEGQDPLQALRSVLGNRLHVLFQGTLQGIEQHAGGGFDHSEIVLRQEENSVEAHILSRNESLIAWRSDQETPIAMGPDGISLITTDGHPRSNADLSDHDKGRPFYLLGIAADPRYRDDAIIEGFREILTPMGYPGPYRPLGTSI